MNQEKLRALLENVQNGTLPTEAALSQLRDLPFEDLDFAKVDHHRGLRQGFPEVIFSEGKTPAESRGDCGSHARARRDGFSLARFPYDF